MKAEKNRNRTLKTGQKNTYECGVHSQSMEGTSENYAVTTHKTKKGGVPMNS